jgi:hypothetical protein
VLERFNDWFSSRAGVAQVFWLTAVVTVFEVAFPHVDPNRFWFLYICTAWSFFTQNALAYSSRISSDVAAAAMTQVASLEQEILDMEEQHLDGGDK